jgi:hypothetical protein
VDVADRAERELTSVIERRSRKGETDSDEREELYMESVRRHREARRRKTRNLWRGYQEHLMALHERWAAKHASKSASLALSFEAGAAA